MKNSTFTNIENNPKPISKEDLDNAMKLLTFEPEKDNFAIVKQMECWRTIYGLEVKIIPKPNLIISDTTV